MVIDGGINNPKVPAPANVPATILSGYPRRLSSGMVILPTVSNVAAEDPEIAENAVQPTTFTCNSPPGMR